MSHEALIESALAKPSRKRRDLTQAEMDRAVTRNALQVAVFGLYDVATGRLTPWIELRHGRFDFRATLAAALRERRNHDVSTTPRRARSARPVAPTP